MKRGTRAEKAQETLKIIEQGYYETDGRRMLLDEAIRSSLQGSRLYRPDDFEALQKAVEVKCKNLDHRTEIKVVQGTVLEAAAAMTATGDRVGCLNFASAKNPGGGFLGGAQAQEESLALSSALYPTLMQHFDMHEYNRSRSTYLYSDHMIYSPAVPVFRNDEGALLPESYTLDFITSPAVNIGAMKSNRPEELGQAEAVMLSRMDKVLGLFVQHGITHLLLGAWGCGVFQNDPGNIAAYFGRYLLQNGKYSRCFHSVVFAIYDRSKDGANIAAFHKVFRKEEVQVS
ncbi:TIGR02452 family protein [Taibaiella koreensis]|uniref:TIGR02452 family protein n=1 Tax=Taibaiella koreensis TaxID=1268548 RepID=UPI000E5A0E4E|nr:TIGR02452 family protein [Taibaiella koreensis]